MNAFRMPTKFPASFTSFVNLSNGEFAQKMGRGVLLWVGFMIFGGVLMAISQKIPKKSKASPYIISFFWQLGMISYILSVVPLYYYVYDVVTHFPSLWHLDACFVAIGFSGVFLGSFMIHIATQYLTPPRHHRGHATPPQKWYQNATLVSSLKWIGSLSIILGIIIPLGVCVASILFPEFLYPLITAMNAAKLAGTVLAPAAAATIR